MDPFLGEIRMFTGNFAPRGWAFCDGSILNIRQYTALYALLGVAYGGNGSTTFALPDLRGRTPIHQGQAPGRSSYPLGSSGGVPSVTLVPQQLAAHVHFARAASDVGESNNPAGKVLARSSEGAAYGPAQAISPMASAAIENTGGSQPHNNLPPFQVINFIIALQGVFPPRS
ncbi:phage tail protein [Deinococcus sp. Leaf326]|jgi:microcystin-dependent protein|uniref:phage tail protein n=1 Tax=Deinococcus sp. Leaf326 TaxID=1736338 RepID=UPI0009E7CFFD|nr:tail fiber protein [Deinococcus sp. Leaf326]